MNFARIIATADIIINAHVLNWFWRSKSTRRVRRRDVLIRVIPRYFKRYLPKPGSIPDMKVIHGDKNDKIFSIWQQGEKNAPPLVKACYRSVRKFCKQELVVLDDETLFDYIELPDVIVDKYKRGIIKRAHFADICRVELLYRYGGYWLDSCGFVSSPIPKWIEEQDFFVYMAGIDTTYKFAYSFIQNCFIRARKGDYLLAAWREMILAYWTNESMEFDYFMHQLMFYTLVHNDPRAIKEFKNMKQVPQDSTHALWWQYRDQPFDQKLFDQITSGAFFQKTTYRDATNPIPGSFADAMINMYK